MRVLYAMQCEVSPALGQAPATCTLELRQALVGWIKDRLSSQWKVSSPDCPTFSEQSETTEPAPLHRISATLQSSDDTELGSIEWVHPHDGDPEVSWLTTAIVARRGGQIEISVVIRLRYESFTLTPLDFEVGPPRAVRDLIQRFDCRIRDIPLSVTGGSIGDEEVAELVEVLVAQSRRVPIIVVSTDPYTERYLIDPKALQNSVAGHAVVLALKDKWSAFRLTDAVGKQLSVYNGAVRLYWPGFGLDADPYDHPLFLPMRIQEGDPARFGRDVFSTINAVAALRFVEGATIRAARLHFQDIRAKETDQLRTQLLEMSQAGEANDPEWIKELQRAWDSEKELAAKVESLNQENAELSESLRAQKQSFAAIQRYRIDDASVGPDLAALQEVDSIPAALSVARDRCSLPAGRLVFLDRVTDTAENSPYKQPEKVLELLEALNTIAMQWSAARGALGPGGWKGALAAKGFVYKPRISQTTATSWGEDYTYTYDGARLLFEEHVTLGAGDPNTCASVHWIRDDARWVLVIGHVGRHLRNTST